MSITKQMCTVSILAGLCWGSFANATVLFDGTFSNGSFPNYGLEANGISGSGVAYPNGIPGHLSLVTDPSYPSRIVMAATRLLGDSKTSNGYRSEVHTSPDPLGTDRWYSWGFYLPDDWDPHDSTIVVAQMYSMPDALEASGRSPTLAISIRNESIDVLNSYDYDEVTGTPGILAKSGVDYTQRTLASWAVKRGQWTYLDMHAVWAADDSGSLEIWKDGISVFKEVNHINTFNDKNGVFFKAGLYAYPSPDWTSLTSLFTGVRIGDGAESLQSMTMVPEPSEVAMMSVGLLFLTCLLRRKRSNHAVSC